MSQPRHISELLAELAHQQAETRMQAEWLDTHVLLKEDETLAGRIQETDAILAGYGISHEQVLKKLLRIMNGPYKMSDGVAQELYTRQKPIKEFSYARLDEKIMAFCPWHGMVQETHEYEISRPFTEEENNDFGSYMTLTMLLPTYEDNNELFDEKRYTKKDRVDYEQLKSECKQLEEKKTATRSVTFTGILPHYIKEHHFFPSGYRYNVDLPFFLHVLGFEK